MPGPQEDALRRLVSLLASLGGTVLGLAGGILLMTVVRGGRAWSFEEAFVPALAIPVTMLAGGILGYEMSQRPPRGGAARGGLLPVLSVTPNATVLGLGGHF